MQRPGGMVVHMQIRALPHLHNTWSPLGLGWGSSLCSGDEWAGLRLGTACQDPAEQGPRSRGRGSPRALPRRGVPGRGRSRWPTPPSPRARHAARHTWQRSRGRTAASGRSRRWWLGPGSRRGGSAETGEQREGSSWDQQRPSQHSGRGEGGNLPSVAPASSSPST